VVLASTASLANAQAMPGHCTQPVGKDFDTASPSAMRMSPWWLNKLLEDLDQQRYDIRALLVMRDCKVVLERYRSGLGRRNNHIINSITKSVTATLVGTLLEAGKLDSLDRPLDAMIERTSGISDIDWAKSSRVTLRHAMTMASGIYHDFQPGTNPFYFANEDRLAASLSPPIVASAGTRFYYSDGDAFLAGAAVASLAKTDLYSYARQALFDPLGMDNHDWIDRDIRRRYPGGYGIRMRPMDLLKLGQLYVQDGVWNGGRLLPSGYARQAWAPAVSPQYGLMWWRRPADGTGGEPRSFEARGWKGQRIYVLADGRTVIAMASSLPRNEEAEVDRMVLNMIGQALRFGHEEDNDANTVLEKRVLEGFRGTTRIDQLAQDRPSLF
jgi:CubicO group peptidase (beta-lactamase class C family)